jgi:phenylalanyl-tRNA synthetase beta chain
MPTIGVDKAALFKELGREYTTEEFDELCFEFGIELDEDTSQSTKPEDLAQPPQLKIEIPANRYDMLCFEGIAMNLKVFLDQQKLPKWVLTAPKDGEMQVLDIKEEVGSYGLRCEVERMWADDGRLRKYGRYARGLY